MRFTGVVEKGSGGGRRLGFPTANIPLSDDSISGIYAAKVHFDGAEYNAAVYADTRRKLLEAHILGIGLDLYGKQIEIVLLKKIREDRVFKDAEEAMRAIDADVRAVKDYYRMP
jgi:FAD synthase